ncbi:TOM1-like protein 2 isoform X6 [Sturnira hondurensis]|uniref:TOM1-like protein 2 isoform X6 n=1 Tax=Sturnira hondurensis TaxID=192404 RepID=UPI00187A6FBC|nr:TOM1-like protein 2 isoform X6 [Sturnira hondurensis]
MEFLLGNPFSTPVGQCLEKATDGSLQSEDWTLNMEICDIINETDEGPKDAIRALKKRLNGNRNYKEVMLALTVLETCVKNCGHRFHVLVASRDFIDSVLVKIISPKNNPPTIVQDKVLALIQIARLRSELDIVRGNTKVMSEMLTEMVPGQEDSSDLELLQELNRTCRAMQQRIVELISRVSNEEVTEELLHVNDDLNNVFLRYERFERYRSGRLVPNASNGVLNEVTEDNLIDLGPGSPAVVSPMVGSTAPPSSLSSQLAGLDLGTESVSGTLSSLQQCHPHDGFDMFAQTRGNSLAEQRKTVTYEDPQAVGGLASALDSRKQISEASLINSLKKEPKLLKWSPTSPRPLWRPQPRPPTLPAERSLSDQRTPSSPCELVCGVAPQMAGPSCLQPLAPPPVPSPHKALWPCAAVSVEMPLYLLAGLPLVRIALATFSPGGRWWDSIAVTGGGPFPPRGSLCSWSLPGESGSRVQPQARSPAHREGGQTLAPSFICPCPFPGSVGLRLACPPCSSVSERACLPL